MKDDTWATKQADLRIAETVIEQYGETLEGHSLGLFEWAVDDQKRQPTILIADWVLELADRYEASYGKEIGTEITTKVVSFCLRNGHTSH